MERSELRPILRNKFPRERTYLLPALHYVQHELGNLPDWALQTVAWHLRVPPSEVYGCATSYSELRIESTGTHLIRVCTGLSCWYNGGCLLMDRLSLELGISPGETSPDGRVTLEKVPCGFVCPLTPALEVDGKWLGRVAVEDIPSLVENLG